MKSCDYKAVSWCKKRQECYTLALKKLRKGYKIPCSTIDFATFINPAIFAPFM